MIRIAIAEDEDCFADLLTQYLRRFEKEESLSFSIKRFQNGYELTNPYPGEMDIVLMDIQMELMDGMRAAQKIREVDEAVIIIFVTNMAQYALEGYRVQALDYILKPITYIPFSETMKRAIRLVSHRQEGYLTIRTRQSTHRIYIPDLRWIESRGHRLSFHLKDQTLETTTYSIKEMEEQLLSSGFSRANSGCLVNLHHVTAFRDKEVLVDGVSIPISRGRKAAFMEALLKGLNQ